ncbi:hypothetical protein [Leptospira noguchii]|uniref:Uncharacterized protein n=1 Tax=Leptospira noguchii TaxID=28182 RepID=A0AAE9KA53_9LEPT|nr:hypothetical protein [Leptospira noguchii]UOG54923.1 hypothetical protein MAL09_20175 [Leptospira noguchii]UOG55863.1 hypothetical protein MAL03_13470 [Leptospira noguchii]UOG56192.1 hypothetical protein MAL03_15380 [Leptospira noguchii]UOG56888.1 hypothetical protein MAL03_01285 [Leptospira noguchii]UOG57472.1 hypothetical protein MAL03_04805 [Leptospira noguchii]
MEQKVLTSSSSDIPALLYAVDFGLVATHEFAAADLDSSMDRGLKPQRSDQSATGLLDSVDSRISYSELPYVQETY